MDGVNANQVGIWVGIVVLLIPAIKVVVDWIKPPSRRIEPQPLEVRPAADYMTRQDCSRMHAETQRFEDQRFDAIDARLSELVSALDRRNQEGESRASKIHQRIDGVVEAVSELRGQVNTHISAHGREL
jgi:uncharacterized protein YicC (UPF0701 family)